MELGRKKSIIIYERQNMDATQVKLYFVQNLTEEANFVIDKSMSSFLSSHTLVATISNCQYQRLEPTKRLKLNKPQNWASSVSYSVTLPNYCSIQNQNEETFYYFIVNIRQKAQDTIELDLQLDVLNSFWNRWFSLIDDKTRVIREHVNRFHILGKDTNDVIHAAGDFSRTDENENPPLVRDSALTTIEDKKGGTAGKYFYLIYRTDEDGIPCLDMAANEQLKIGSGVVPSYSMAVSQMTEGRYYYAFGNITFSIKGHSQQVISGTFGTWLEDELFLFGDGLLVFWKYGNYIAVVWLSDTRSILAEEGLYWDPNMAAYTRKNWRFDRSIDFDVVGDIYFSGNLSFDTREIASFEHFAVNAGTGGIFIAPISVLDRTDSKIVKVIECPYCPVDYTYNTTTGVYTFPSDKFPSTSPEGFLRTYDISSLDFLNTEIARINLEPLNQVYIDSDAIGAPKGTLRDPKLYTSPFYQPTFIYDSFSQIFKIENLKLGSSATLNGTSSVTASYKQSSAISSALIFEAKIYGVTYVADISESNFPEVLAASRNNEIPLYSSEYLSYMKNGFNYDKKKIQEQAASSALLTAMQLLGSILSFAAAPATGGISAAAGVSLLTSAATSATSQVTSYKQAGEALEQKINLLKNQAYNVSNIDDLNLFKRYGKNRLLFAVYKLKEEDKNRLADKFYYYGYAANRHGAPVRSRLYFGFYQAQVVWKPFKNGYIQLGQMEEYLDLIKEKIAAGVTFFYREGLTLNNGALRQDLENLEKGIYDLLTESEG